jgi:hypothetical protein
MMTFNALAHRVLAVLLFSFFLMDVNAQGVFENRTVLKGSTNFVSLDLLQDYEIIQAPSHGSSYVHSIQFLGKFLVYSSSTGYAGRDTLILKGHQVDNDSVFTYLGFVFNNKGIVAENDFYFLEKNEDLSLNILNNDSKTGDSVYIANLVKLNSEEISITIEQSSLNTYYDGEGNDVFLRYISCNELQDCDDAYVHLKYIEPLSENENDTIVRSINSRENVFMVFDFTGFTYLKRATKGFVVTHRPNVLKYVPFVNTEATQDTITVSKTENGYTSNQTYIINIVPFVKGNNVLAHDFFRLSVNEILDFNVLDNDLLQDLEIDSFVMPNNGEVVYLGDGNFSFIPQPGFVGSTSFEYSVCLGGNCEWATVTLQVLSLTPQFNNYNLVTSKNAPLIIRFNADFEEFTYNFVANPSFGNLEFLPGHQSGVLNGKTYNGYNLLIYSPLEDYVGQDVFHLEYCLTGLDSCKNMMVEMQVLDYQPIEFCLEECVWPGDTNNDGIVSGLDLLSLGYNVGEAGMPRENIELQYWVGQEAENWGKNQGIYAKDMKFIDSDGDGLISLEDADYIDTHYLNTHAFHIIQESTIGTQDISVEIPGGEFSVGDTAVFFIVIGSQDNMVTDMNGFSFSLDYDPSVIDASSINIEFIKNNFLFDNAPTIELVKHPFEGRLDISASRLTKDPVGGYGIAIKMEFIVIDDIDGFKQEDILAQLKSSVGITSSYYMDGKGALVKMRDTRSEFVIRNSGFEDLNVSVASTPYVNVFPNPAQDYLVVVTDGFNKDKNIAVQLMDMNGNLLYAGEFDAYHFVLDLSSIPMGMYLLHLSDGMTHGIKKISKVQ